MKLAFVFSPQGAQKKGMGKALYAANETVRSTIDEADGYLSYDLKNVMFESDQALQSTKYAQMALFVLSCAIKRAMNKAGVFSSGSGGLSLGEYAALFDRDVFDFHTGVNLVEHRGHFMETAVQETRGRMVAVRSDLRTLKPIVEGTENLHIANYNLPNQFVVSGTKDAVDAFEASAKSQGIKRVHPLDTAGAFHTPLMNSAATSFQEYLHYVKINAPQGDFYSNTIAKKATHDLETLLVKQIINPVKFYPMIKAMIEDGYDTFVELGTGKTLTNFIKKIDSSVATWHVEDSETLENAIKELKDHE